MSQPYCHSTEEGSPGRTTKEKDVCDYRALNSLLPPVTKANSKAKGVLTCPFT